jgi:ABC-type lipoprotein release transport system permease subunit
MGLMPLVSMSWRNLWRQKRRTAITLSSIALACFLAVIMIGVNDANWEEVINTAARMGGGHVTVQHRDYEEKPSPSRTVRQTAALVERLRALPHVTHALPRIVGQVMLATTTDSLGAGFIAYDPAQESPRTLSILEALKEGTLFRSATDNGIILGARLARNLGVGLGDKVVYTLTDKRGEIVSALARVSGVVRTGSPAVDLGLCFLPLGAARQALGYAEDEAVQVAVFLDNQRASTRVRETVARHLGGDAVALTWKQTQPDLDSMIAMKKGGATFFSILMLVLCAAGIFNTLFVSVIERIREFGILVAVGFGPRRLFSLVMLESLWLGLTGLVVAVVLVAWPYHYLGSVGIDLTEMYATSGQQADIAGVGMSMVLRVGLYPESAVAIAAAVLGATLLSGLYPAWKAGHVEPVDAIKLT